MSVPSQDGQKYKLKCFAELEPVASNFDANDGKRRFIYALLITNQNFRQVLCGIAIIPSMHAYKDSGQIDFTTGVMN